VERGKVKVGEEIEIVGFRPTQKKVVTGVEMFRKLLDEGLRATNVGLLLRARKKKTWSAGKWFASPVRSPRHEIQAEAYVLTKEERPPHAVSYGYRRSFISAPRT